MTNGTARVDEQTREGGHIGVRAEGKREIGARGQQAFGVGVGRHAQLGADADGD